MKYNWKNFAPTWEGIPFVAHTFALVALAYSYEVEVHRLPPFKPNDFLFKTHEQQGKEKWEIFAWGVRQAMAKFGNLKLTSQPNADKLLYKYYLRGREPTLTYAGKTWDGEGNVIATHPEAKAEKSD